MPLSSRYLHTESRDGKDVVTLILANGERYVGGLRDMARHGVGWNEWEDGSAYTGTFVNDVPCGKGVLTFVNGNVFSGIFQDGVCKGNADVTYSNGSVYCGSIKYYARCGFGYMQYARSDETSETKHEEGSERSYRGWWKSDKPHGVGTMEYDMNKSYTGQWRNGIRCGMGTFIDSEIKQTMHGIWLDNVLLP